MDPYAYFAQVLFDNFVPANSPYGTFESKLLKNFVDSIGSSSISSNKSIASAIRDDVSIEESIFEPLAEQVSKSINTALQAAITQYLTPGVGIAATEPENDDTAFLNGLNTLFIESGVGVGKMAALASLKPAGTIKIAGADVSTTTQLTAVRHVIGSMVQGSGNAVVTYLKNNPLVLPTLRASVKAGKAADLGSIFDTLGSIVTSVSHAITTYGPTVIKVVSALSSADSASTAASSTDAVTFINTPDKVDLQPVTNQTLYNTVSSQASIVSSKVAINAANATITKFGLNPTDKNVWDKFIQISRETGLLLGLNANYLNISTSVPITKTQLQNYNQVQSYTLINGLVGSLKAAKKQALKPGVSAANLSISFSDIASGIGSALQVVGPILGALIL